MVYLNYCQLLLVSLLIFIINATLIGGEETQCNEVVLNMRLRVSELEAQNARLQLDVLRLNAKNKELLENHENCTGLIDQTNYITESLKTIQSDVKPLKSYVQERFQANANKNDNEDKAIQQLSKQNESVNLTAVAAEVNHISQSVETFLQKCQTNTQTNVPSAPYKKIGNKYYYIEKEEKLNWYAAALKCRSFGGNLVNIETAEEFNFLKAHLPISRFWISGNDLAKEGDYFSIATGNRISYTHWAPNEPNNRLDNENCIEIIGLLSFEMNDNNCGENYHYICEANLSNK